MKTLFLILFPFIGLCQITVQESPKTYTVGRVAPMSVFNSELIYSVNGPDTTYTLLYRNLKYSHIIDIKSFSFGAEDNTLSEFYKLLKSYFGDGEKKDVNVTIGKTYLKISLNTGMGNYIYLWTSEGYFYLTEKQLDKLFGKR